MISSIYFYCVAGLVVILIGVIVCMRNPESVVYKILCKKDTDQADLCGAKFGEHGASNETVAALEGHDVECALVAEPFKLLQGRHGSFLANKNNVDAGQAIINYGECCEIEVDRLTTLTTLTTGTVIEVGSNVGTGTVALAKTLAKTRRGMIVFEPQPFIFQNLCANLALNAIDNVRAWPLAVGVDMDLVYFPAQSYAIGVRGSAEDQRQCEQVGAPCVRLDDFLDGEVVGMIKIDVNGSELEVLKGARKLIDNLHPTISIENDRIAKSRDMIEWLWDRGYRLWWNIAPLFNADNHFGNAENTYDNQVSVTMICVHESNEKTIEAVSEMPFLITVDDAKLHPLLDQ